MMSLVRLISMVRYAITGEAVTAAAILRLAEHADFVQVRTPGWDAGLVVELLRGVSPAVVSGQVLVHGRVDVAMACGAAGVHLSSREGELSVAQVRKLMPGAVVSVSAHSVEEVSRARGADFMLFAPVFEKRVDGEVVVPGVGLERLREACVAAPGKVLALGGVTEERAKECLEAGAVGVAGIRLFG